MTSPSSATLASAAPVSRTAHDQVGPGASAPSASSPHAPTPAGSVGNGQPPAHTVDLIVVGSGAGGLSAAVTAAARGLSVLVLEKTEWVGGTSAWSGGWMWVPRNPLATEAGLQEPADAPTTYLRHELGDAYDAARIDALLAQGPRMVDFFRTRTALSFIDGNAIPDFHGHSPGAATGGRSLCAAPFDGRQLGDAISWLRPPLDLISFLGMGIASGADVRHFMQASRAWPSFWHVSRRVARHLFDLLRYRRGMQLVNGNALVARLLKSALDLGVHLRVSTSVTRLLTEPSPTGPDRVTGVEVATTQGSLMLRARQGVVLACGGYPHDQARMAATFAHVQQGTPHHSAAPTTNTGDGLRLGEAAGASLVQGHAPAAWAPVSLVPRADGSVGHFPHLLERAKPGVIAVTRFGQRFGNEADSYYDVMQSLFAALPEGEPVQAWLVCDHRFIRRYGLGHAKPAPVPLWGALRSGYLKRADSLSSLARQCGIQPDALQATVAAYNAAARDGLDPLFHRGGTPYNRIQGDASHQPNPCVAPIEHGPFYAVRIVPGSLGTFAGLRTDAYARVQTAQGDAIPGLYACGNDQASVMGGRYPSGGITLGPAMTFGYIAAHHAAGQPLDTPWPTSPLTVSTHF